MLTYPIPLDPNELPVLAAGALTTSHVIWFYDPRQAPGTPLALTRMTVADFMTSLASTPFTSGIKVGTAAEASTVKGIYQSGNVSVTIPSFAAETTDSVDVDVSGAFTVQPAVGDLVLASPSEALPTDCLFAQAYVVSTDTIRVTFDAKEGGGVTGAAKNFKFLLVDMT